MGDSLNLFPASFDASVDIMNKPGNRGLINENTPESSQSKPAASSCNTFAQEEKRFLKLIEGITEMAKEISRINEAAERTPSQNRHIH